MTTPLVSVEWLLDNIENPNLVIIDATLNKVTRKDQKSGNSEVQIKHARYLDIKHLFSDVTAEFPNTMLSPDKFQEQAQLLGINNDSVIVVYDAIGIYSSPRVWWMFRSMGHQNISVLNGGLPEWIANKHPTENTFKYKGEAGNFTANYDSKHFKNYTNVLQVIDSETVIIDARSKDRYEGEREEPREGLRRGRIPSSLNIHYEDLLVKNNLKSVDELSKIFASKITKNNPAIFSCGSGITACILALGATISGYEKLSVYDGSWTEWGSINTLPIEIHKT